MANYNSNNITGTPLSLIDMTRLWPGTSGGTIVAAVTQTATQFRITVDLGGGVTFDIRYQGTGFTYSGLTATGGTYTSVNLLITGTNSIFATLGSLSPQALADIYTVTAASLPGLDGNDQITGGIGNDVLRGGAGNDLLTDSGGTSRSVDGGSGNDEIRLFGAFTTASVNGGTGTDTLSISGSSGINSLTVANVEILHTFSLTATAAFFESFDTIRSSATNLTTGHNLTLVATGGATVLNLADELTSGAIQRSLILNGTADSETVVSANGNDRLLGGAGNDVLTAAGGNDFLQGDLGNDRLFGGDGNDTLFAGSTGNDTLFGGVGNDTLGGGDGATFTAYGGDGNDTITTGDGDLAILGGGNGDDRFNLGVLTDAVNLTGDAGNDIIDSDSTSLSGTINGGIGTDSFIGSLDLTQTTLLNVENLQGTFTMRAAQAGAFANIIGGITLVASGAAVTLDLSGRPVTRLVGSSDSERLTITAGSINGFSGNDVLTTSGTADDQLFGDLGNDTLFAGAGNDQLDGGEGDDTLNGGDGADSLVGAGGNDTLFGGAGSDTIRDFVSFLDAGDARTSINAGAGADQIILTAGTFSGAIDGGADPDTLILQVSSFSDVAPSSGNITELAITGVEELLIGESVTARVAQLEAFDAISNTNPATRLVTIKLAATGAATVLNLADELDLGNTSPILSPGMQVFGSRDNETILSNRGDDILDGGGGVNTVSYSLAFRSVYVDLAIEDRRQFTDGGGWDTLSGFDNLTGSIFADSLRGSAFANVIVGGLGADVLNGRAGADTLTGGSGADSFVFDSALGAGNIDRITDFDPVQDIIGLANAVFTGLVAGTLAASAFAANATGTASDPLDRIIYDTATGALYFDANGSAAGGRTQFASLTAGLALTNADFTVF